LPLVWKLDHLAIITENIDLQVIFVFRTPYLIIV